MMIESLAMDLGAAWLAKKAVEAVGLDLTKVADHVVDDVVDVVKPLLPSNPSVGRIVNTTA